MEGMWVIIIGGALVAMAVRWKRRPMTANTSESNQMSDAWRRDHLYRSGVTGKHEWEEWK